LRHRLFRVRGVIAEVMLYGTVAVAILAPTVMALEFVSARVEEPVTRYFCMAGIVLIPLLAWVLTDRFAPILESAVLCPLDPRRGQIKELLGRVLHASVSVIDAQRVCELTLDALGSLCEGRAIFYRVPERLDGVLDAGKHGELPQALLEHLELGRATQLVSAKLRGSPPSAFVRLSADALIAVHGGGELIGALVLWGFIDQEVLATASAMADNLGSKLAHQAMYQRAFRLQAQLEDARGLATLGSFVAAIAHDIRTPLTSMKMNVEMIRARRELDDQSRECVDFALEEVRRMNDYVSGMLDYVKPVQLRCTEFALSQLIEETGRTLQPLLDSRKVALHCEIASAEARLMVRADAIRMKQVLVNLIENAADASAPGDELRVIVSAAEDGRVVVRVIDRGHGVAAEDRARIFEPFFTTRHEGTGLGLAIVDKLVRAHDGEITLDSIPGVGSTFAVSLPAWPGVVDAVETISARAAEGAL
jgi:signal transduction histidine kinase